MIALPEQVVGRSKDIIYSRTYIHEVRSEAFFQIMKMRLLNVNHWGLLAGTNFTAFQLFDKEGTPAYREPHIGDFIKIDIPLPGSKAGKGYEWMRVALATELTTEDTESVSLQLKPSHHPYGSEEEVAHFLAADATTTIEVKRERDTVTASLAARNESLNTQAKAQWDKLRNGVIYGLVAIGIAYPQWSLLLNGIINDD